MTKEAVSIIGQASGILSLIAFVPYIISIYKRETIPNKATWLIWSTSAIIIYFSFVASGANLSQLWLPLSYVFGQGVVALLTIKFGEKRWTVFDKCCVLGAAISLLFWYVFKNPAIALLMNITIDFFGALPTLRKSFLRPWTEDRLAWLFTFIGASLNLLTISSLSLILLIYPLYMFTANGVIAVFVFNIQKTKKNS